jgi:hypothetical protein
VDPQSIIISNQFLIFDPPEFHENISYPPVKRDPLFFLMKKVIEGSLRILLQVR